MVLDLLKEHMLKSADKSKGFLIDGYPREVPQAKKFEEMVSDDCCRLIEMERFLFQISPCNLVLYVKASDDTMTKRLLHRGQTSGRVDDNEETIKNRLKTFHNQTMPVLDLYEKQGKVAEVNGEMNNWSSQAHHIIPCCFRLTRNWPLMMSSRKSKVCSTNLPKLEQQTHSRRSNAEIIIIIIIIILHNKRPTNRGMCLSM